MSANVTNSRESSPTNAEAAGERRPSAPQDDGDQSAAQLKAAVRQSPTSEGTTTTSSPTPNTNGVESKQQTEGGDERVRSASPAAQQDAAPAAEKPTTPPAAPAPQSPEQKPETPTDPQAPNDHTVETLAEIFSKAASISSNSTPPRELKRGDSGGSERRENSARPKQEGDISSDRSDAFTCYNGKRAFKTDREYNPEADEEGQNDLEAWQPDEDVPQMVDDVSNERGWSVDAMFRANTDLGVKSDYNGIEAYSTAMPVGDEEDRRRADQMAREIERSKESNRNAMLENDDEERDLDKETRFDGRGQKRQSGGYSGGKNVRSQYNGGGVGSTSSRGAYSNGGPRNAYPKNVTSSSRYEANNPRYQQRPYATGNPGPAGGRPPKQPPPSSPAAQPAIVPPPTSASPAAGYNPEKSPSLHADERRQSSSPAAVKNPGDSSSIRRTNSAHNKPNPLYNTRPEGENPPPNPAVSHGHPAVEVHAIGPKSQTSMPPPTSYGGEQQSLPSASQPPPSISPKDDASDKPKKKFTFNPNAAVFVPKNSPSTPKPPPMVPINVGAAHQLQQQQHAAAVVAAGVPNMPHNSYASVQQMMPMTPQMMPLQSPLLLTQQPFQQIHQQLAHTQPPYRMQSVANLPPQITGHNMQQQSSANLTYMNHTGTVSAAPYAHVPPPVLQQQAYYPPNMVYGFSSVAPTM
ncbi:LsmAD and Ataxin-2 domain containing protein [Aphelenchoides fujianensis]|nr:LsmAD and Ataxin-2 domain containing protein [Aphelenchoides fujianensis]